LIQVLAVYIAMVGISILAYRTKDPKFSSNLIGLGRKNLGRAVFLAVVVGGVFFLVTKLVPGFSIGTIRLPQSIGDTIRNIVVLYFAPVVESIFFQGFIFAFLRNFMSVRFALISQAIIFSVAHVAAYVQGFYNYPAFTQGLTAFQANAGSFIAAFLFAYITMFILIKKNVRNMWFAIIFHFLLNLIITALAVIFFL